MPPWKTLLPALALLLLARPASAQAVRGELVEVETGRPVAGAFVVLLDEAGREVAGSFSDAEGSFFVQAPAAGRYTLRAERVGRGSARSPAIQLDAGRTVEHALEVPAQAVQLEGLVVQAEKSRCATLPEAGAQTAALWEEARKALSATAWTQARRRFRFTLQQHARMLDAGSLRVISEQGQRLSGYAESPFVSAPAERLARDGFVHEEGDSTVYYAPDARVLLSDEFLETHCFRVQEGVREERGLAGLAFEPVRGRRPPDVRGVLWLDPATAELRHLEYTYTGLDLLGRADRLGGRVEFERLPTGEWIVPRWRIRMPVVGMDTLRVASQRQVRRRVAGIRESAGEVLEVRTTAGALIRSAARAALSGTVWDSTRAAPLAGARVRLAGTAVEVEADAQGRFRIADVAEGRYAVVFSHPRADSLQWIPRPSTVDLRRDAENAVELAVPPLLGVLASRCTPAERRAGTGVVAGVVRQPGAPAPPMGTPVLLAWAADGATPAGRTVAWTDAAGSYVACAVPPGVAVEARAGTGAGAASQLRAALDRPVRHDLEAPPSRVAAAREVTLDPLVVSAGSALERRTRASGTRMDVMLREEIEEYRGVAFHAGDLVRRIPNVRVEEEQVGRTTGMLSGVCVRETRRKQGNPCAAVIVDDVPSTSPEEELLRLNLAHLESIEWVPPVLAMSRYGPRAQGGALVVYTRGNGPYARRPGR
ncbi:MAG TPA: carboxypeptidase-like regulatory domain-containing protein [Longimicrobiaceae bacterium]|nr:carboxypeptidase-like regulatory domain-containing protein [Longimicrobiaceae bacterium]